jgi:hypothetical protein
MFPFLNYLFIFPSTKITPILKLFAANRLMRVKLAYSTVLRETITFYYLNLLNYN